jgi:radical SAM-linked protein
VTEPVLQRLRITFAKTEAMRFTGHLDLHRAWERSIRRAGLPLAYTQGFNPHPRINLASALPLGFTSDCELIDIWLEKPLPLADLQQALERALPPGIKTRQIVEVDLRLPALQTELLAAVFEITFLDPVKGLVEGCAALLQAESLPRQRRGKPYDLRPLVDTLEPAPDDVQGCQRLLARLSAREGAVGRPEEVADALGADPTALRVFRRALIFQPERN